eukprot:XP_005642475.2 laminin subunit alpha-5-like [Canis lupus familiaris]
MGATGPTCEPFGGQCPCRAHVIGRDCSRCATGYWGFPSCRPCECRGRLCDELTGHCVCPPRTVPPDCVVCQPQTFGCHPLVGCEECNCSGPGVQELTDPTCDVDSGQCKCRPNVAGRRCDTCAPGFHGYPSCRPCDCHEAGSMPSVCDPLTGQCHCKENVQGPRCDQCRLGTFSLDATNPKGCTRCFCFGATERCRSSALARRELVDMEGWTLLSSDRQVVPHELRAEAELLYADLRRGFEAFPELYWQAPPSYLGDRVSSYGGTLRYELHSETQRGDVFIPRESRPDVVLQGNQMSITFLEPVYPAPGHVHQGQLQLVEGNFRHTETHNAVSREELMMVLAGLEQLHIRALFSQTSSAVSLRRVALEVAGEVGGGPPASNVELCMCPANYREIRARSVPPAITETPKVSSWVAVSPVSATATQTAASLARESAWAASTTPKVTTVSIAWPASCAVGRRTPRPPVSAAPAPSRCLPTTLPWAVSCEGAAHSVSANPAMRVPPASGAHPASSGTRWCWAAPASRATAAATVTPTCSSATATP